MLLYSIPIIGYYALLPDIDHKMSKSTWFMLGIGILFTALGALAVAFEFISTVIPITFLFFGITILIITYYSAHCVQHRGCFHTIQAALLAPLLLIFFFKFNFSYYPLLIVASLSYYSHLVGDKIPFKVTGY
jgi:hypothetical protein